MVDILLLGATGTIPHFGVIYSFLSELQDLPVASLFDTCTTISIVVVRRPPKVIHIQGFRLQ